MSMVETQDLCKVYGKGETAVHALRNVNMTVEKGEFVALLGASGSGKSTLLHMLGAVDQPTSGKVAIDGVEVFRQKESELAVFRRRKIGFVFQFYNLIPVLDAEENILLPVRLDGQQPDQAYLEELLTTFGMQERRHYLPNQLSGGQQQRIAVARAFAVEPDLLMMDEPYGQLDIKLRFYLEDELVKLWKALGSTVLFVTHNIEEAVYVAERILVLTNKPTNIKKEIVVDLPRPRDTVSDDFIRIRKQVTELIRWW